MALKIPKRKAERAPSDNPEVNAARLGWTEKPTMAGPHWVYERGAERPWRGPHVYDIDESLGTLRGLGDECDAPLDKGMLFLKIITPKPPETAT